MARPRLIEDTAVLQAAYELIMEVGPSRLTLEMLGTRVGLKPASLIKRFETKQQLIFKIDQYALEQTSAQIAHTLEHASPLEAIIDRFVAELQFATTVERFANGQEFLLMDLRTPELYANYRESFRERHAQVVELLKRATEQDLLVAIDNYDELATHVAMIAHGAGHVWAMTQDKPIEEYIRLHIERALTPYRVLA